MLLCVSLYNKVLVTGYLLIGIKRNFIYFLRVVGYPKAVIDAVAYDPNNFSLACHNKGLTFGWPIDLHIDKKVAQFFALLHTQWVKAVTFFPRSYH